MTTLFFVLALFLLLLPLLDARPLLTRSFLTKKDARSIRPRRGAVPLVISTDVFHPSMAGGVEQQKYIHSRSPILEDACWTRGGGASGRGSETTPLQGLANAGKGVGNALQGAWQGLVDFCSVGPDDLATSPQQPLPVEEEETAKPTPLSWSAKHWTAWKKRFGSYSTVPPEQVPNQVKASLLSAPARVMPLLIWTAAGLVWSGWIRNRFQACATAAKKWCNTIRRPGGLARGDTWKSPKQLCQAWNDALSPRLQFGLGCALGLIASPTLWLFRLSVGRLAAAVYLWAEVNHFVGLQLEEFLYYDVSPVVADAWWFVDNALEVVRDSVRVCFALPVETLEELKRKDDHRNTSRFATAVQSSWRRYRLRQKELFLSFKNRAGFDIPDESLVLPGNLQRGLLAGLILGFLAAI